MTDTTTGRDADLARALRTSAEALNQAAQEAYGAGLVVTVDLIDAGGFVGFDPRARPMPKAVRASVARPISG